MPLVRKPPGSLEPTAKAPPPDAAAVLAALASDTADERWSAARAAAELPGGVTALGEALKRETDPRVREAIFTGLARIATPPSVEAVLPFLRSNDASVRTGALDALSAMKAVVWPYLAALVNDGNPHVRVLACELVRNLPSEQAAPLLIELLDSETDPNVCGAAVDALAETGGLEALPVLARCAERFKAAPFLLFAIKIAADRVRSQTSEPRA